MTTITVERSVLYQALELLDEATTYTGSTSWSPSMTQDILSFCVKLRAALSAPATAPDVQLRKDVELLLTNADWNVGGVLSEESRRRDYPSNGVAHVRLRDLARLRDALKGTP